MIRFKCPECDSQMEVDESFAGRPARCPTCGAALKVPTGGESTASRPSATPPPGAARVRIGDEEVDVIPPLETMVLVSIACVALSVVVFVLAGLLKFVTPPWAVGALLGALLALLGVIVGVPAYHSVRRSRGRRRGRTHATISMLAGAGLFLVLLVIAIIGLFQEYMRPSCEQNLKHIYAALRAYAENHGGAFPPKLETLVDEKYLDSNQWLTCPAYRVPVGRTTYVLTPEINLSAKQPNGSDWWVPDTMIVSDGPPYGAHKDGQVRALLLDGTVKRVPVKAWSEFYERQQRRWNETLAEIRAAQGRAAPEATTGSDTGGRAGASAAEETAP